eukprot:15432702-Alexandrium_andersonii.AAC.2
METTPHISHDPQFAIGQAFMCICTCFSLTFFNIFMSSGPRGSLEASAHNDVANSPKWTVFCLVIVTTWDRFLSCD